MKIAAIRSAIPANGGAIIERRGVDINGNPTFFRVTTWVGPPPPGAEGLGAGAAGLGAGAEGLGIGGEHQV